MPVKQRILSVVGPLVADTARVAAVSEVSEHFRMIDLEMDPGRLRELGPVDKVKINAGGWNMRTYTPLLQTPEAGILRLLAYLHGSGQPGGPGARWAAAVRPGDTVQVGGPKAALQVKHRALILVGDETSVATALNLQMHAGAHAVLEATDAQQMRQVLAHLQISNATVVPRRPDGGQRIEMAERLAEACRKLQDPKIIFTGHAQTIQKMGRALKASGVRPESDTKPHWADRKVGLD